MRDTGRTGFRAETSTHQTKANTWAMAKITVRGILWTCSK